MEITKKKKNKFIVPQEYNQSVIFASGGQLFDSKGNIFATGADLNLLQNIKAGNTQSAIGQGLGAVQGGMQLGSQIFSNFDTSGIGKEIQSTNDISRGDIMNSNVNVDSMQSNVAGQSLTGAMTGAKAGMSIAGPLGAGIGAGVGLIGSGISSIFGNKAKQRKANETAEQWTDNLEAKDRQFNQQDLRSNMANFSANGGDLFAYGGNIKSNSPLTEFNAGQKHEQNPNGGVMQGTGANGQPNLVEQGETKHEDYIFSDRLKIDPKISKEFKLPAGLNGKTFADASKYLSREGKDRPNDPISNNAIKVQLAKLTAAQEGLKEQMQPQGILTEQPNANILAQGFAKGGDLKSTPISNNNFWGYEDGQYTPEYTKDVDDILSKDWDTAKKYMTDNNINYAQTPEGFRAAAFDRKVGDVHKYIQGRRKDTPVDNITYTHTTDRNFYDSGQLSPEEKALYNPETLTRTITKEEFDKAMKTNEPVTNSIGAGYRENRFAFGGDQTHYHNPTHQGANIYAKAGQMTIKRDNRFLGMDQLDNPLSGINQQKYANDQAIYGNKFNINPQIKDIHTAMKENEGFMSRNPDIQQQQQGLDYSRYAPVAANMITGIGDMFQNPEVVKYGRVSPEMNISHMDYQPIDTEWMNNKMNATYAGTRDQMINNAGGNRAAAMAGLSGINQQQQNAVGEAYLKAQDINYGRKQQANQFNAGIEQQNVAAQNQAQQLNLQIAMQEAEMNARNRAAKRNAARQAIIQSANDLGQIGRENWASRTGGTMTEYTTDPLTGVITYADGSKYKRDASGNLIKQ